MNTLEIAISKLFNNLQARIVFNPLNALTRLKKREGGKKKKLAHQDRITGH